METRDEASFDRQHLVRWLETSCDYLLGDPNAAAAAVRGLPPGRGARERFLYRARGKLMFLLKGQAPRKLGPLEELERTFTLQANFVTRHPEAARQLIGWSLQAEPRRIGRRVHAVIGQQESRLCRIIEQARGQGLLRREVESGAAAKLLIGMIQGLALRVSGDRRQREELLGAVLEAFAGFLGRACTPAAREASAA